MIPTCNPCQNWGSPSYPGGGLPFVQENEVGRRPQRAAGVCLGFCPLLQLPASVASLAERGSARGELWLQASTGIVSSDLFSHII